MCIRDSANGHEHARLDTKAEHRDRVDEIDTEDSGDHDAQRLHADAGGQADVYKRQGLWRVNGYIQRFPCIFTAVWPMVAPSFLFLHGFRASLLGLAIDVYKRQIVETVRGSSPEMTLRVTPCSQK